MVKSVQRPFDLSWEEKLEEDNWRASYHRVISNISSFQYYKLPTFNNSSNLEKYLPLEWTPFSRPKIGVVFSMLFLGDKRVIIFFFCSSCGKSRELLVVIDSLKRLFGAKNTVIFTVFTWSGPSKERDGKKLKLLMNWRWQDVFSPLSVLWPYLVASVITKEIVFSESKWVPSDPQIPGPAPEMVIIWFRLQSRINTFFSSDKRVFIFFFMREVKRNLSWNRFLVKVICTKSAGSLTVFT